MSRPFARGAALAAAAVLGLAAASKPSGVFREATKASGIRFRIAADLMHLKLIPTMIGGCAFGDYDGDGRPDLYVTSSVPRWSKPNPDRCGRLYRNLGGGKFEDVTAKSGIRACGLGMGAFWVDLDGDGRLDLYLTNVGKNAVWWNRGDGTFEEGKDTGLEDPLFSVGAAFLDYDGDGKTDVVVANYLDSTPEWEAGQAQFELRVPEDYVGQPSRLYRNLGGRKFADVTREAGLAMDPRETKTLGVAALDYDGDGLPDLFFANDRVSNRLFHNVGGRFEETTAETGAGVLGDRARAGMGIAVGDPFASGRPSVFVTNFGGEPNSFYRNLEGAVFEDGAAASGLANAGERAVRWGTHFADFDNDGRPDLYAVGGHLAPRVVRLLGHYKSGKADYVEAGDPSYAQPIVLMRNTGDRFVEWKDSGDLGRVRLVARGTAVADVDGDGGLDVFVVDLAGPSRLFVNTIGREKSWIEIDLAPGADGRTVLGARVRVTARGHAQTQWNFVTPSYASGSSVALHFGLNDAASADEVEIVWPGGAAETYRDLPARKIYRVRRGSPPVAVEPGKMPPGA